MWHQFRWGQVCRILKGSALCNCHKRSLVDIHRPTVSSLVVVSLPNWQTDAFSWLAHRSRLLAVSQAVASLAASSRYTSHLSFTRPASSIHKTLLVPIPSSETFNVSMSKALELTQQLCHIIVWNILELDAEQLHKSTRTLASALSKLSDVATSSGIGSASGLSVLCTAEKTASTSGSPGQTLQMMWPNFSLCHSRASVINVFSLFRSTSSWQFGVSDMWGTSEATSSAPPGPLARLTHSGGVSTKALRFIVPWLSRLDKALAKMDTNLILRPGCHSILRPPSKSQ